MNLNNNFFIIIFILIIVFGSIYTGYYYRDTIEYLLSPKIELKELTHQTEVNQNYSCSGNLKNISNCMVNNIVPFYKYNMSNLGKILSEKRLIEEGGVCLNWANYYNKQASRFKLYSRVINYIDIDNQTAHAFTIVSNEEGYCILDQTLKPLCNYLF